jgi:hypothetical protein
MVYPILVPSDENSKPASFTEEPALNVLSIGMGSTEDT